MPYQHFEEDVDIEVDGQKFVANFWFDYVPRRGEFDHDEVGPLQFELFKHHDDLNQYKQLSLVEAAKLDLPKIESILTEKAFRILEVMREQDGPDVDWSETDF